MRDRSVLCFFVCLMCSLVFAAPAWAGCEDREPFSWAVVIGVSDYEDDRLDLDYAATDARAYYEFLRSEEGGNIPDARIAKLFDSPVTASMVRTALGTFLNDVCEQDYVIIYLAGHGVPDPSNSSKYFFLAHDAKLDNLSGTAVWMDELGLHLRSILAEKVMLIADTCHSAGFKARGQNDIAAYFQERLKDAHTGLLTLTSAQIYQEAIESDDLKGGVFTHFLLKGLTEDSAKNDRNADGIVDAAELYPYLVEKVRLYTNGVQIPDSSGNLGIKIPMAVVREPAVPEPSEPEPVSVSSEVCDREYDFELWASVKDSEHSDDFRAYLNACPNGGFRQLAELRWKRLVDQRGVVASAEAKEGAAIDTDSEAAKLPLAGPRYELEPIEEDYVTARVTKVRDAPSAEATVTTTLDANTPVTATYRVRGLNWLVVAQDDKRLGFVYAGRLIAPPLGPEGAGATVGAYEAPEPRIGTFYPSKEFQDSIPLRNSRIAMFAPQ